MFLVSAVLCLGALSPAATMTMITEDILRDHEEKTASKPNVIFIVTDDQDATLDSMEYMPKTQALIGKEGLNYDQHHAITPFCCPSRATILTGMYTHNHNISHPTEPLGGYVKFQKQLGDRSIAVKMQELGYTTHMTGKYLSGFQMDNHNFVTPAGWTDFRGYIDPYVYEFNNTIMKNADGSLSYFPFVHQTEALACTVQDMLSRKGQELQNAPKAYKPFFFYIAPVVPHDETIMDVGCKNDGCILIQPQGPICACTFPPRPMDRHANLFSDKKVPRTPDYNPESDAFTKGPAWLQNMVLLNQSQQDRIDWTYQQRLRSLQGVDEMVSDIVVQLSRQKMLDNTYIIYTSDNGYHLGHLRLGPSKLLPYENDIKVPFLVRGPGLPKNQKRRKLTGHEDIFSAIMTIGGAGEADIPTWVDGLVPSFMEGARREVHTFETFAPYFSQESFYYPLPGPWLNRFGTINMEYSGVVVKNRNYHFKFIYWCEGTAELYNLTADPYEVDNLFVKIDEFPELIRIAERMDALTYVMSKCQGDTCRHPLQAFTKTWNGASPPNFGRAMKKGWDKVFSRAPRMHFLTCADGHFAANELAVTRSVLDLDRQQPAMRRFDADAEESRKTSVASKVMGNLRGTSDINDPRDDHYRAYPDEGVASFTEYTYEQLMAIVNAIDSLAEAINAAKKKAELLHQVAESAQPMYFPQQKCAEVMRMGKELGQQLSEAL